MNNQMRAFLLTAALLAVVSLAAVDPGAALDYPDKGPVPTPMWGDTFRYKDPLTGAVFNNDGTNSGNPVVEAGSTVVGGVTYLLKNLQTSNTITFQGTQYTVYSAVPQDLTIDYAYKNTAQYYDPNSLVAGVTPIIDFTIPATINGGNPTEMAAPPTSAPVAGRTGEMVYLTKAPTDPNSLYFIPNLPNSSGGHDGLTAHVYFMGDPFKGKSGYWPDTASWPNGSFHLVPYGWASDPRFVAKNFNVQLLDATGGAGTNKVIYEPTPILRNFWKHVIQGYDKTYQTEPNNPADYTVVRQILQQVLAAIRTDPNYPFPPSTHYPAWLEGGGVFFHVQPQPGFQRNLLRYYTAWGAVDVYNQASDLFVRPDGSIEFPAVQDASGTWRYAPVVTQTWDGSQRYTLLNLTDKQVPSTYTDYPGYEYYLPSNVYLPGRAGVVTTYVDYLVQGSTGLAPRETDMWLGLKGDTAMDVLFWGDAPVSNTPTEPGGQANKPYMFGASTYIAADSSRQYSIRLQSSNSFCIARLPQADLTGKLYDASFYADVNNGQGYKKAATISYQWQPWTIDATGKWVAISDGYGAGVPQLTFADTLGGKVAVKAAAGQTWNSGARTMGWGTQVFVDVGHLSNYANKLTGLLQEYFATASTSDPNTKFLIVLNPRTEWTAGSGDWGTAGNWSAGVPGDYNNVYLEQSDATDRTITYNNTAATAPPLSMLRLDATGTGTLTLQVNSDSSSGDLKAEMTLVGAAQTGNMVQSAGTVTLTDKLLLGFEQTAHGTYTLQGGTYSAGNTVVGVYGTGTFTQSNGTATISGTLTLAAQPGSTGTYNLSGGTLNVGTLTQNAGGTFNNTGGTFHHNTLNLLGGDFVGDLENQTLLTGYGTITGTLTNSGVVSSGSSLGSLGVVGSYVQTATGAYAPGIASGSSYTQISVGGGPGTASLAGTLAPTLLGGYLPRGNQVFPGVVSAPSGLTGSFSSILNQQIGPTLFWQAQYSPTGVDLWVQRDYTNPGLGLNTNQAAVGTMLNGVAGATGGDLDTVLNAIDTLPDSNAVRGAFKQISPEKAGSLTSLGFVAATYQMRNLASRTTNLRFIQGEGVGGSSLTPGSFNFKYSKLEGVMLAYNGASLADLFSARKEFQAPESRWGLFAEGGWGFGNQNSTVNQTGYNFTVGGCTVGADYRVREDLLVGLATGYSQTRSSFYGSGGSGRARSVPINAYGAYFPGAFYAYGSLGYALNLYDLERDLRFGEVARKATSATTGNQFNLYGEAGYDFKPGRFILTPSATLAYSALWVNGFTEQDAGALNLKVAPQSADSVQTGVGGRLSVPVKVGKVTVVPQGYAFYQHEFANGSRGLKANLSQGSGSFTFRTDAPGRNYALVGASVTAAVKDNLYVQVNGNAEVGRRNTTAQFINAGLRYEF